MVWSRSKGAPSPAEFVRTLSPAVRQAATIAVALEGRVANRPKFGEASEAKAALTTADTAAQEAILVPLHAHFPDLCLEAEEDTPSASRFPAEGPGRVVIDPIDGTLHSYLEGRGPYAVIVGLALDGRYAAALLALPREALFFAAARGGGARVGSGEAPGGAASLTSAGQRVFVSHGVPGAVLAHLRQHGLEPVPACGGAVAVAPLVPGVCGGLRVAHGDQGVSVRGRVGTLIAREAGALVCDASGSDFPEDLDAPARALLVASDAGCLGVLRGALRAAGV